MRFRDGFPESLRRHISAANRDRVRWLLRNFLPALRSGPRDLVAAGAGGYRVPGPILRSRVARDCSRQAYLEDGARLADSVLAALLAADRPGCGGRRWLDFGCGSGRVARHLLRLVVPASFVGLDVDAGAVGWCQRHLPGRYLVVGANPPTPLPDAGNDVVVAISVFTHFDPQAEAAWLAEMHRLLAPGGLLVASTHSERLTWEVPDLLPDQLRVLAETGTLFVPGWGRFNSATTFHTRAHLERAWSSHFSLRYFGEHGLAGYQDVSVWERSG